MLFGSPTRTATVFTVTALMLIEMIMHGPILKEGNSIGELTPMRHTSITPEERYTTLVKALLRNPEATYSRNSLWVGRKMFAFSSKGKLIVKLPQQRVYALVTSEKVRTLRPRQRPTPERMASLEPTQERHWLQLAREAMKFAASKAE